MNVDGRKQWWKTNMDAVQWWVAEGNADHGRGNTNHERANTDHGNVRISGAAVFRSYWGLELIPWLVQ